MSEPAAITLADIIKVVFGEIPVTKMRVTYAGSGGTTHTDFLEFSTHRKYDTGEDEADMLVTRITYDESYKTIDVSDAQYEGKEDVLYVIKSYAKSDNITMEIKEIAVEINDKWRTLIEEEK